MVAQPSQLTNPAAALPSQPFERFFLRGLLPGDHVIVSNTYAYMVSNKPIFVLTRLDGHLYRLVGQTAFSEEEWTAVRKLFDTYPNTVSYADDLQPVHRVLARCQSKLAELGIVVFRRRDFSYGIRPIMNESSGK